MNISSSFIIFLSIFKLQKSFYTYIMIEGVKIWLTLLVLPLFFGIVIHFLVPLQIILVASPKIESAFNSYKLAIQQQTVRANAFQNARVIRHGLQSLQYIQTVLLRYVGIGGIYDQINLSPSYLNSAYEIANMNQKQLQAQNLRKSMWFTGRKTISPNQQSVFKKYMQIQLQVQQIMQGSTQNQSGIKSLELTITGKSQNYYFRYPSAVLPQFKDLNTPVLSKNFNLTLQNYLQHNIIETTIDQGEYLVLCTIILHSQSIKGIICLKVSISQFIQDLTQNLEIPNFQYTVSNMYILRPIYSYDQINRPQIVANFSSTNPHNITIPIQTYLNITNIEQKKQLFQPYINYYLNMYRAPSLETYYTLPVYVNNYLNQSQTSLFFMVVNQFKQTELSQQSFINKITIIMIVPAVFLLFFSIIGIALLMRYYLKKLQFILKSLVQYCSLILKGDLQLEIKAPEGCMDFDELFIEFQKLNKISKYSNPEYFNKPKQQRIILYLQAYNFFKNHKYNTANLCENIADCYNGMGQINKAIDYIKKAIEIDLQFFKTKYGSLQKALKLKNQGQIDKKTKDMEKSLSRKIRKQALFMYSNFKPGDTVASQQVQQITQILRRLIYPRTYNLQYIGALVIGIRYRIRNRDFSNLQQNLQVLDSLIRVYQKKHYDYDQDCNAPPDVIRSYWNFMSAICKMKDRNMLAAFDFYLAGLNGNYYNPVLHAYTQGQIKRILEIFKIDTAPLQNFRYKIQQQPRANREYIMMMDVSNPSMSQDEMRYWKKQNREIAQYIFNYFIYGKDRLTINEFCSDVKILCNLIQKQNQQKLIRKQIYSSFKCRDRTVYAHFMKCLKRIIERVKNLILQKYFIIFLKQGMQINGKQLAEVIKTCQNSKFIFIVENQQIISDRNQSFYTIQYKQTQDIDRILEEKNVRYSDNKIYLF